LFAARTCRGQAKAVVSAKKETPAANQRGLPDSLIWPRVNWDANSTAKVGMLLMQNRERGSCMEIELARNESSAIQPEHEHAVWRQQGRFSQGESGGAMIVGGFAIPANFL